jgi:Tfp pilus assembly protein PilZ
MRAAADTIRIRAGEFINSLRRSDDEAWLDLEHRGRLDTGDAVRVEVSFGPMADEVDIFGEVSSTSSGDSSARWLSIELARDCEDQLRYVQEVLGGNREAAARRHRRLPSSLAVRWGSEDGPRATHLLDISAGGAFIVSEELPEIGKEILVQFRTRDILKPLRIQSTVSWVRPAPSAERRGFGVSFKVPDAASASMLSRVVREHETAFAGHDWR